MRFLFLPMIILLVLVGCGSHQPISPEDLKTFVLDVNNGLIQTTTANGIRLEIVHRPKDLVLQQEAENNTEAWHEAEKQLDSLDYFVLKISHEDREIENRYASNPELFNAAVQHLSSNIERDIILVTSSKFPLQSALYSRSFGASKATTILLVFKSHLKYQKGTFSIVFEDSFFGTGRSEFQFDSDDIKNIPRLKS